MTRGADGLTPACKQPACGFGQPRSGDPMLAAWEDTMLDIMSPSFVTIGGQRIALSRTGQNGLLRHFDDHRLA